MFVPFDSKYRDAIVVIKTDEIADQDLFNNYVDVIYNSRRHVTIALLGARALRKFLKYNVPKLLRSLARKTK